MASSAINRGMDRTPGQCTARAAAATEGTVSRPDLDPVESAWDQELSSLSSHRHSISRLVPLQLKNNRSMLMVDLSARSVIIAFG
jgi:hypothetical protein